MTHRRQGTAAPLLIATLLALAGAHPVHAALVTGTVVDRTGAPVEYASVAVRALSLGAVTEPDGRFSIELSDGNHVLLVMQIGYERRTVHVNVHGQPVTLRIVLLDEPVPVEQVTVTASAFGKAGKSEGAVVRRMDIVTTPGGAADIFQSLRALPGINAPNEGAALYVRGGDPSETLIRMDGGELGHPYHFEGASGGLFSALDSYMLKSAFFSSGGFPSKYGGVLSGVLDIETQDPMNLRTVSMGANMVGGGLSSTWSLMPDRLSVVGSLRWARPDLLFRLYGTPNEYQSTPESLDGVGRVLYRYSPTGRVSTTYLDASNDVRVIADVLNVSNRYAQTSRNRFGAVNVQDVAFGRIAVRGQASAQRYDSDWSFGPVDLARAERNAQANLDAVWPMGRRNELSFGLNIRHRDTAISGLAADDSTDLESQAATRTITVRARVSHPGAYVEHKLRVWGPLYATAGGRLDWASQPGVWTADPRAALAWRVGDHQTIRLATGRYHQLADPARLDRVYGNPHLRPLRADHVIAGYEWDSEFGTVRVEAYRKDYRNLVTQSAETFYANGGHGYARGIDVFVQGTYGRVSGWTSYGYLDSRRKELDDPRELPSAYGVRHSLTLVSKVAVHSTFHVGARYTASSGRAVTPVIGATYDGARDLWQPVYGEHRSDRLPSYDRLDIRLMRLFSLPAAGGLPESSICVAYIEAMNVLDTRNVLDYVYSSDYSERRATESYFGRRMLVAGVALTW